MRSFLPALAAALLGLGACASEEPADDTTGAESPSPAETTGDEDDLTDDEAAGDDATDDEGTGDDAATGDDAVTGDDAATEEAGGDADTEGSDEGEAVADLDFVRCEADDLTVEHPASWTVYEDADVPPCRVFHPEPIEDFHGENLHYAVRLYIDPVEFEDATGGDSPAEELSREEATVDGHDAVVIERRHSGEAMIPEDAHSYTYTVDLDGMILIGTTTSVGDTDYERDKQVLDRMMETVTVDVRE